MFYKNFNFFIFKLQNMARKGGIFVFFLCSLASQVSANMEIIDFKKF